MGFAEEYSHSVVVSINGTPLADDVANLLVGAYVDESRNVAALFVLRFSDPHDLVLDKARVKVGAEVTIAAQSSGPGGPVDLMAGQVTAIERDFSADGAHTVVRGLDHSHSLLGGARVRAFVKQTAADIVRAVGGEAGLRVDADSIGPTFEHLTQDGLNDWEFLRRLADSVGAVVTVGERTLRFKKPVEATSAPSGTSGARQNQQVLEVGVNVVSLRAALTATAQVPNVEVRGWDVKAKKELVSRVPSATKSVQAGGGATPVTFAQDVKTAGHVESASVLNVQASVAARATSLADRRAGGFAELDGTARGNAALRAGTAILLKGAGTRFDGKYVLSSVRHDFDPESGYLTSFTVSNGSERSLYGAMAGGDERVTEGSRGVVTAIVTNLKDPDKLGRVKVSFPVLSGEYESWWARTVQPGAGSGRGATVLPEVNDEVLVAFGQGDVNEPYVLGGLYNGKDKPGKSWDEHVGSDGLVTRRAMTSRKGMIIEMVETPSEEKLTVSTNAGAQRITLLQKPNKGIEIISEGPVTVTAKEDATVTAQKNISVTTQSGKVALKGMEVSVEATTKLLLKGAQVAVEGTASLDAKAANIKIAAQAAAELSAGAMTTVRGALVKIN